MPIVIEKGDRFNHDHAQHFAVACPSCSVMSHLTPVSTPRFDELTRYKPKEVGVVFRCDACNAPVFLKYPVKAYGDDRIELSSNYSEIERPVEHFDFTYLPEDSEVLFREALSSFSRTNYNAFASMCRRTVQRVFDDLGETGKMQIFDQCNDIRDMAEIDDQTYELVRRILFDTEDVRDSLPLISAIEAGILLEFMRDVLYQAYVRKGKIQQAMMIRRYLAEETEPEQIEPPQRSAG